MECGLIGMIRQHGKTRKLRRVFKSKALLQYSLLLAAHDGLHTFTHGRHHCISATYVYSE